MEDVAAQIAAAEGPSGPNRDYLFNLAEAMRGIGVEAGHGVLRSHTARFITPPRLPYTRSVFHLSSSRHPTDGARG